MTRTPRSSRGGIITVLLLASGVPVLFGGGARAVSGADEGHTCPSSVRAEDVRDFAGGAVRVTWEMEREGAPVDSFVVLRYASGEMPRAVGAVPGSERSFVDRTASNGVGYQYIVRARADGVSADCVASSPATASPQWISSSRGFVLAALVVVGAAVITHALRRRRA